MPSPRGGRRHPQEIEKPIPIDFLYQRLGISAVRLGYSRCVNIAEMRDGKVDIIHCRGTPRE
jgi:hypothetical protein